MVDVMFTSTHSQHEFVCISDAAETSLAPYGPGARHRHVGSGEGKDRMNFIQAQRGGLLALRLPAAHVE
jgi:hypothetical protein